MPESYKSCDYRGEKNMSQQRRLEISNGKGQPILTLGSHDWMTQEIPVVAGHGVGAVRIGCAARRSFRRKFATPTCAHVNITSVLQLLHPADIIELAPILQART